MVLIKPILFCLMLLSWSSHGSKPSESSIGYESVEEALNAMKNSPGAAVRYENGWTVVNFQNKRILWLFTPEDHPAHPSAVKREVVHNDKASPAKIKGTTLGYCYPWYTTLNPIFMSVERSSSHMPTATATAVPSARRGSHFLMRTWSN